MAYQDILTQGKKLTRGTFADPPLEMGIVPFWFWNGELDYDEMEWQLRQYYDRGVRSLFLHGRMGLKVPYLSDEWFERVKFAVEKGKEIGIDVWVYDEMDWPSGTADKQVLEEYPHVAQRYMELVALPVDGPLFTFLEAHDDRYVNTGDSRPIAAYGVPREEYETTIENVKDLSKNLSFEKTIPWEAPDGDWMLLYFLEKESEDYVDVLSEEGTAKFIELTHEKYKEAVGDDFGGAVPGFFTDEPAMHYYHVGLDNYVVPWSRQMFKIFRERRGYDLKPHLPALYKDVGEDTARIRYDFWKTLTEQYRDTYYGQIREWCEDNDVLFTGHLLFEEMLRLATRCEGNIFKYLEQMHVTGVDHLYPRIGTEDRPQEHVALKIGSSAAHHFGSERLLCESMGGTYWDCTLERMKWMANWEYVLGVNIFNNHGYHYSIEGERKRDWPPSQFYHHTWWPYYDRFTDYMARLGHLLTGGRHVAKVLMLHPLSSLRTNYTPQHEDEVSSLIEQDFYYLTDTLLRLHYDFDYVDEDVLADATVEDGEICIADERFSIFVLPPTTHLKAATLDKLRAFVEGGGSLIADTLLPVGLLETNGTASDPGALFDADPQALLDDFRNRKNGQFEVLRRNGQGNVFTLKGRGLHEERPKEQLREILHECAPPDVTISDEDVFYLHRVRENRHIYFLVNTRQEDKGTVQLSFENVGRPELWDADSGETKPVSVYDVSDGRLELELDFPPSASRVVVISDEDADVPHVTETNLDAIEQVSDDRVVGYASESLDGARATVATPSGTRELTASGDAPQPAITLPEEMAFAVEQDNALLIEDWKMTLEDGADGRADGYHTPDFDDGDWLNVTNGAWELQLPQERDEATYPVPLWYRTSFEAEHVPDDLRLMIDGFSGDDFALFVNGREIEDEGERSWLDAEIREVGIAPHVREGRNVVAVRLVANRRTDGMLDLLKIVGDFALAGSESEGYALAEKGDTLQVGDWTDKGYPFFSGTGVYRADIDVPEEALESGKLYLEADCGEDVLGVRVNDSEEHVAPWHPYRLDVTDLLQPGENAIEVRVTNTLINLLEGKTKASGLMEPPRLVHEPRYELTA